jgi:transcriptional regulator with XRE-family HTH domain
MLDDLTGAPAAGTITEAATPPGDIELPVQRPGEQLLQHLRALGRRVGELRESRGWSRPELADRAGISRSNIHEIERGAHDLMLGSLLRLAGALDVPWSFLLGDRPADTGDPESRLHEALDQLGDLRAELKQLRSQLTLAQARAQVAQCVAEETAAQRITAVAERARLIVDRLDRPRLAALLPKQLAAQLEGRRALYECLDELWREGRHGGLDQRPEWVFVVALRDLAQYLTSVALDTQMHRN